MPIGRALYVRFSNLLNPCGCHKPWLRGPKHACATLGGKHGETLELLLVFLRVQGAVHMFDFLHRTVTLIGYFPVLCLIWVVQPLHVDPRVMLSGAPYSSRRGITVTRCDPLLVAPITVLAPFRYGEPNTLTVCACVAQPSLAQRRRPRSSLAVVSGSRIRDSPFWTRHFRARNEHHERMAKVSGCGGHAPSTNARSARGRRQTDLPSEATQQDTQRRSATVG